MSRLDFFMQIVGFFIQVAPFAMLMFVPYQQDAFLQEPRLMTGKVLFVIFLTAVLFSFYLSFILRISTSNTMTRQFADLYFLGVIISLGAWFIRLTETDYIKTLLVLVIVMHYGAFIFSVSSAIYNFATMLPGTDVVIYCIRNNVINVILLCLSYPITFLFMKRIVRYALPVLCQKTMKRGCAYMMLALVLYCVFVYTLTFSTNGSIVNAKQILYLAVIVITDCIVYYMFFCEAKIAMENHRLQQLIQFNHTYYQKLMNDIEDAKRTRHDVRHHLNMIAALHSQGKSHELTLYLKRYANVLHERDELVITGHTLIDSILNYYRTRAKSFGIVMKFQADNLVNHEFIEITEITVLSSTALDKAIEKCKKESIVRIDVSMYLHNQTLLFMIAYQNLHDTIQIDQISSQDTYRLQHICEESGGSASSFQKDRVQIDRYVFNLKSN